MDDIEIHKTVSTDNEVYENTRIAVSVLDNTNSGMNEYYEPIQRPPKDSKSKVSKSFCTAEAKQKIILLILVATCVSISVVSLVIALTIQEKETHVAFNAYYSSVTSSPIMHTVTFTKILLNEGGGYNETSGIFTTPFSGLYQFNGHVCTEKGNDAEYALQTERQSFASGEHTTPSDASGMCTSLSAVISVLKDEKVWISSQYLFQNSNDWNSFSGILIHKM